jgi:hypothetical protein
MYLANICFLLPAKIVGKEHLAAPAVPPSRTLLLTEGMFHAWNTSCCLLGMVSETSARLPAGSEGPIRGAKNRASLDFGGGYSVFERSGYRFA